MYCCQCYNTIDLETPRNELLTPFYRRSYAFFTVKTRMPAILQETCDILIKNKSRIYEQFGKSAKKDLKQAIKAILLLKEEMENNDTLKCIESNAPDRELYNEYLGWHGRVTFFTAPFLLDECYVYRRVYEAFKTTDKLNSYDPFGAQKEGQFFASLDNITVLAKHISDMLNNFKPTTDKKEEFIKLLKLNLWGNKLDLSLSFGKPSTYAFDPLDLEQFILCDHSEQVWSAISDAKPASQVLAIVCDNVGYELFSDCCLADFVISAGLVSKVHFYIKAIPWCVSDTTLQDFNWFLNYLKTSEIECLRELGTRWTKYVIDELWCTIVDDFWTLACDFTHMKRISRCGLYARLAKAKLVLFKGDMNYRKLVGDKNWDPTTPIHEALQGFHPTRIAALRMIKSNTICGLDPGVAEATKANDPDWMGSGNYGVIQYSDVLLNDCYL